MNIQPPATGRTNTSSDKPSRQTDRQLTVAIDGDDTLWHNETLFVATHDKLRDLLIPYIDKPAGEVDAMLLGFERRNLSLYGYGIKGFTLSMIEPPSRSRAAASPPTTSATCSISAGTCSATRSP